MEQMRGKAAYVGTIMALMVALAAAGCGGSGTPDPLKKSEFIAQADAICRTANSERTKAMREAASSESEATELVTETALPPIQKMTEELSGLGPPVGDQKEVQAIISAFEQGIKKIEADPTNLHSVVHAFDKADELSEAYGLVDCTI
jgi:hypothetical protein